MTPAVKIITTSDGSYSLINTVLNETYHSIHGAIQESDYVFLKQGLEYCTQVQNKRSIRILEIGFGTGLNAFLTALHADKHEISLYYESWEAFPVDNEIIRQLNYTSKLGSVSLFERIHSAVWNTSVVLTPRFSIHKRNEDVLTAEFHDATFDLIYYDAFAPSKQPEMWTTGMLKKITGALSDRGIFVTYCAKGQLKRDLTSFGFIVETLPGPPGKKEMVRAIENHANRRKN